MNNTKTHVIMLILVRLFGLVLSPFVLIWCVNTLFSLTVAYGFFEWLAAMLLLGLFSNTEIYVQKYLQ